MAAKRSSSKPPLKPSQLGDLYPTPKTYDEHQQDTKDREAIYDARRTKLAAFKIALFGTLLFAAAAYYAISAELLWAVSDTTITAMAYALWFVLFLFAIKWLRYTANIFYEYASRMAGFWVSYAIIMSLAFFAWQQGIWLAQHDIRWLAILTGLQFVATYLAAKLFIKRG